MVIKWLVGSTYTRPDPSGGSPRGLGQGQPGNQDQACPAPRPPGRPDVLADLAVLVGGQVGMGRGDPTHTCKLDCRESHPALAPYP
jgi:hypothetical protein